MLLVSRKLVRVFSKRSSGLEVERKIPYDIRAHGSPHVRHASFKSNSTISLARTSVVLKDPSYITYLVSWSESMLLQDWHLI